MINNAQTQNLIYYCDEINIYNISKLLFFIGWNHKLMFIDNQQNVWSFNENDRLLLFTNTPIQSCNVEHIIISNKCFNSKNLIPHIRNIALSYNMTLNINSIEDIDQAIYNLLSVPALQSVHKVIKDNKYNGDLNLPILVYKCNKNPEYADLCRIFTHLFQEIGCHSLALILYNIINVMRNDNIYQKPLKPYLINNMILY